jgi:hypothetical protein
MNSARGHCPRVGKPYPESAQSKDFDITDRIAVRSPPTLRSTGLTDFVIISGSGACRLNRDCTQPLEDEIEIDDEKLTIEVRKQSRPILRSCLIIRKSVTIFCYLCENNYKRDYRISY